MASIGIPLTPNRKGSGKFGKEARQRFLELLRGGYRMGAALLEIGIHRQTIYDRIKVDPSFKEQIEQAELDACEHVEDAVYQMAIAGNLAAAQMWLFNRSSSRWKDRKQVEATTPLQVNIQVNGVSDINAPARIEDNSRPANVVPSKQLEDKSHPTND